MATGYRILSFDGGPGVITTIRCLHAVERRRRGFVQATDMFVGSSAGAFAALYLALHVKEVKAGTLSGEDLLKNCAAFVDGVVKAMMPADVTSAVEAWLRFAVGKPMFDPGPVAAFVSLPQNFGTATLGSLTGRAVVQAARMNTPWEPHVYDSLAPGDAAVTCTDAALASGAFPLLFPIQGVEIDGGISTNSPTMVGLSRAVAGALPDIKPVPRKQIRLLALGMDSGSSTAADLFCPPGRLIPLLPPLRDPVPPRRIDADRKLEHLGKDAVRACKAVQKAERDHPGKFPKAAWDAAASTCAKVAKGAKVARQFLRLQGSSGVPRAPKGAVRAKGKSATTLPWGWPEWIGFPSSPVYLAQVMLTSEALGVQQQAGWLLEDRALRLAPMAFVESNDALVLMMIGFVDFVIDALGFTAEIWQLPTDPFGFVPSFRTVDQWVAKTWT